MCTINLSKIAGAAGALEMADIEVAADIFKMVVELWYNGTIYCALLEKYGPDRISGRHKRKINGLIQKFIVQNHFNEFMKFCEKNHVTIFYEDLETDKRYASNARLLFVIFLREDLKYKPSVKIVDVLKTKWLREG